MEPETVAAPKPGTVTIGPDGVHGWLIDLDGWPCDRVVLDPAERARAASYLRPLDRARFAASRSAVRVIASGYLGGEPGRLRLSAGGSGQLRLAGHSLHLSLSRCGGVALLAVSPDPVGADLELICPRSGLADLAAARFAPAEAACIAGGCAGSPVRSFYRHWVAKEAYLKATGRGLAGLRETELACGRSPVIRFQGTPEPGWQLTLASGAPSWTAAIVGSQPVTTWLRIARRGGSAGVGRRAGHGRQDRSGRQPEPDPGPVAARRSGGDGDLVTVLQPGA